MDGCGCGGLRRAGKDGGDDEREEKDVGEVVGTVVENKSKLRKSSVLKEYGCWWTGLSTSMMAACVVR